MHNSPRSVSRLITVGITSALFASTFSAVASAESATLSKEPLKASPGRADTVGVQTTCNAKPIFFGYYRTWRDKAIQLKDDDPWKDKLQVKLTDIPEHVNMVSLFHVEDNQKSDQQFWETFHREYQPELKKRGTRVVRTVGAQLLLNKIKDKNLYGKHVEDDYKYREIARDVYNEYVVKHNLDGLDVDMELRQVEKQLNLKWQLRKIMGAFSELMGPKAPANEGKKPDHEGYKYLIYDTFDNAQTSQVGLVADLVDYVLAQTYKKDTKESVTQVWNGFRDKINSCQFMAGYAHPEENDTNRFLTAVGEVNKSGAMQVAEWKPEGGEKGGTFAYALDRDGRTYDGDDFTTLKPTDFAFTKRAIELTTGESSTDLGKPTGSR
ncbi:endo-beta-N-acetylglucosaminidase family protein [Corynebacterium pseudotuberculosis]|uniref:mannosyl-glycoprotein endo-beta-N-acetylglucosaminidase n=2 Tax=Corynebacterium pseudotuberculosis TaxID=1719 RepID=D9QCR3_CORP2|nr:endo-beta-N-acetylglucosaminidase family protein [Corynebacterium pseudotuberculosis]AAA67924.1 serine proteinase precursor [Corynebacterium pseudotuberculosis]ADK29688.1 protease [Corynebacterium pseudotuberculosis FRC41]ADL11339.1 protease [Corynebacterium pseudotuberculosis C231]ADL21753.1 protease [Corynebacterium pseudotuberculosis 1002]ADO27148.1 protease [Corynebacterium pseudotuberculosis I19]